MNGGGAAARGKMPRHRSVLVRDRDGDRVVRRGARAKLVPFEAIRGGAALVVVLGHFSEGLAPSLARTADGTLLAAALNGPAAVVLFFVLSGFVLAIRPIGERNVRALASLVLKRWPRLAGTVVVSSLLYIAIALIGGFPDPARVGPVRYVAPYVFLGHAMHNGNILDVLSEAAGGTFLYGTERHNPALWTMHWEFLGSFLVAGLGLVLLPTWRAWLRALLFVLLAALAARHTLWLAPFPIGVAGALLHLRFGDRIRLPSAPAVLLIALGALIWSWDLRVGQGVWSWTEAISFGPRFGLWIVLQTLAAVGFMAVALYHPGTRAALDSSLGSVLGRLSFPVYLTHLGVMLSFSAWVSIFVMPADPGLLALLSLFCATMLVLLLVAVPLAAFDVWWVRWLARVSQGVLWR
jgi:peptidoglycan/LPS O-acetylase OafA/YrhL